MVQTKTECILLFILHLSHLGMIHSQQWEKLPWTLRTEESLTAFKCLSAILLSPALLRYNLYTVKIQTFQCLKFNKCIQFCNCHHPPELPHAPLYNQTLPPLSSSDHGPVFCLWFCLSVQFLSLSIMPLIFIHIVVYMIVHSFYC